MLTAFGGPSSGPEHGLASISTAALRRITSTVETHAIRKRSDGSRTTTIVLSTVLSVVGLLLIAGAVFACLRWRRRRTQLFSRSVSPIDDDEIATWKGNRREKELENGIQVRRDGHQKQESVSSTRKPASVIVYPSTQRSGEPSPRLPSYYGKKSLEGRKISFDKEIPSTPIQARAPNAREGLTDDAVPGDDPFVQSPRRHMSRLSRGAPPSVQHPRQAHTRTKSARSSFSLRSFGDNLKGYDSDVELTPRRASQEGNHPRHKPAHTFPSSAVPPQRSPVTDEWAGPNGLSPAPNIRKEDIGRAIG